MAQTIEGLIRGDTPEEATARQDQSQRGGMTLAQFREKYPQYDDMTDQEVARNLHRSFYSDIPFDAFAQRIQLGAPSRKPQRVSPDQPRNLYDEVSGFASQVRASIPGTDELQGAIRGAGRAVEGFVNPTSQGGVSVMDTRDGISLQDRMTGAGNAYREGYGREVERERAQRDDFAERRPLTSLAAQLPAGLAVGGAAAGGVKTGANLLTRTAMGAGAGAGVGAVYGAASEGNLQERGMNALTGGGTGAAFGAAFPLVINPAFSAAGRGLNAGYQGTRNALFPQRVAPATSAAVSAPRVAAAQAGNARQGSQPIDIAANTSGAPPVRPVNTAQPVRETVDRSLLQMAERRKLTPEIADEMASTAEATGRNPLMAQVLGEPGLQRLQTNASLPGQAAQRTADTIAQRRAGAVSRASEDIDQAFGEGTRQATRQNVAAKYEELSPRYNETLSRAQIAPESATSINGILARIPREEMSGVRAAGERIAQYDGLTFRQLPEAQQLHYIKMGLDQRIGAMAREGLQGTERQRLVVATKALRTEMERAIPGYRQLNGQWMDNVQTDEALSWADEFFAGGKNALRPEEIAAEFQAMSPAQKQAALVSIRTRMLQTVEDRGRTGVRKTNVVDPFLSDGFENRMRAIFGDKADDLMRRFRAEDRDFAELGSAIPRSNSKTAAVFSDMVDQMATMPTKSNVLTQAGDFLWRKATNPLFEAKRNKETERLLREMTPAQIRALREALKRNVSRRVDMTRGAVSGGASGAAFTE